MSSIHETKHGLDIKIQTPEGVVLEKFDSRFQDYEARGYLLHFAIGTIASNVLTITLPAKPGAKVWVFPMIPYTVTSANQIVFDSTEYADSGNISDGNEVLVACLINQADLKTAGQPH